MLIFSIAEQFSCTLQGKEINVDDSFTAVNACTRTLQSLWTDDEFEKFFKQKHLIYVKNQFCQELDCNQLRRINDGAPQYVFSSVEEYYEKEHFEAIDIINGELERRFFQESFSFVRQIEKLYLIVLTPRVQAYLRK